MAVWFAAALSCDRKYLRGPTRLAYTEEFHHRDAVAERAVVCGRVDRWHGDQQSLARLPRCRLAQPQGRRPAGSHRAWHKAAAAHYPWYDIDGGVYATCNHHVAARLIADWIARQGIGVRSFTCEPCCFPHALSTNATRRGACAQAHCDRLMKLERICDSSAKPTSVLTTCVASCLRSYSMAVARGVVACASAIHLDLRWRTPARACVAYRLSAIQIRSPECRCCCCLSPGPLR